MNEDISRADGIEKDPNRVNALLRSISRNISCEARIATLVDDLSANDESLCIRDLRIYAESIDGSVYHYRDKNGLKIDAIVQLADGRWGAIEVKLGAGEVDKACDNLLKLKQVVDTDKMNEPSFLMVLTGTEYAFQMKNGIWIVPLGCLKN